MSDSRHFRADFTIGGIYTLPSGRIVLLDSERTQVNLYDLDQDRTLVLKASSTFEYLINTVVEIGKDLLLADDAETQVVEVKEDKLTLKQTLNFIAAERIDENHILGLNYDDEGYLYLKAYESNDKHEFKPVAELKKIHVNNDSQIKALAVTKSGDVIVGFKNGNAEWYEKKGNAYKANKPIAVTVWDNKGAMQLIPLKDKRILSYYSLGEERFIQISKSPNDIELKTTADGIPLKRLTCLRLSPYETTIFGIVKGTSFIFMLDVANFQICLIDMKQKLSDLAIMPDGLLLATSETDVLACGDAPEYKKRRDDTRDEVRKTFIEQPSLLSLIMSYTFFGSSQKSDVIPQNQSSRSMERKR